MQRAVHIWKKLLRTATEAESKQVQDVTTFMSAKGSGSEKEKEPGRWDEDGAIWGLRGHPQPRCRVADALRSCWVSLLLGEWKGIGSPLVFWEASAVGRGGQKWVSEVVAIPMSLSRAPRGSSPAVAEPSTDGQSPSRCRRCGSTVGPSPATLGLLRFCPFDPQQEDLGGTRLPAEVGGLLGC